MGFLAHVGPHIIENDPILSNKVLTTLKDCLFDAPQRLDTLYTPSLLLQSTSVRGQLDLSEGQSRYDGQQKINS